MKRAYKTYRITLVPLSNVAGRGSQEEELDKEFEALSSSEALKDARAYLRDELGLTVQSDGRFRLKARRSQG